MPLRLQPSSAVIAVVVAALAAAPWPDGEITGKDVELVARPRRVGTVRLDADAGHAPDDAIDPSLTIVPIDRPVASADAAAPSSLVAIRAAAPIVATPRAVRLARATVAGRVPAEPPGCPTRARAPPAAA